MKSSVSKLLMSSTPLVFASAFMGVSLLYAVSAGAQGVSINPYPNAPKAEAVVNRVSNADTGVKAGDVSQRLSLDEYKPEGLKPILTNDEDSFVLRLPELSSARSVPSAPVVDAEPVIVDVTAKRRVVNVPSINPPSVNAEPVATPSVVKVDPVAPSFSPPFSPPFSKDVPKELLKASAKAELEDIPVPDSASVPFAVSTAVADSVPAAPVVAQGTVQKVVKKRKTTRELLDSVLSDGGGSMPADVRPAVPSFAAMDVLKKLDKKSADVENVAKIPAVVAAPVVQPVVPVPAPVVVEDAPAVVSAPKLYSNAHEFQIMVGGESLGDVSASIPSSLSAASATTTDFSSSSSSVPFPSSLSPSYPKVPMSPVADDSFIPAPSVAEVAVDPVRAPASTIVPSMQSEIDREDASSLAYAEIEALIKPKKVSRFVEKPIVGLSEEVGAAPVASYPHSVTRPVARAESALAASVPDVMPAPLAGFPPAPALEPSLEPALSPVPAFTPEPFSVEAYRPAPMVPKDRVSVQSVLDNIEREVEVSSLPAVAPVPVSAPAPEIEVGPGLQVIRRSDFQEDGEAVSYDSAPSSYSMRGQWKALQGYELKEILYDWSRQAGVELVWDTQGQYATRAPLLVDSSYESAVQMLLDQYQGRANRPIGQLYTDPDTGIRYLVIRTSA